MASIFMHKFDTYVRAYRAPESAEPWQAITVAIGGDSISLSREESIQLEADLHAINTQAAPVEQEVAA